MFNKAQMETLKKLQKIVDNTVKSYKSDFVIDIDIIIDNLNNGLNNCWYFTRETGTHILFNNNNVHKIYDTLFEAYTCNNEHCYFIDFENAVIMEYIQEEVE